MERLPALVLGEIVACMNVPPGTVNLLTEIVEELAPTLASHERICGLVAVAPLALAEAMGQAAAESVKRVKFLPCHFDCFLN